MKYRVIKFNERFYVQKYIGLIFKKWEYLNVFGSTVDFNHDYEDASPISFSNQEDAIKYMERINADGNTQLKVVAWM